MRLPATIDFWGQIVVKVSHSFAVEEAVLKQERKQSNFRHRRGVWLLRLETLLPWSRMTCLPAYSP
jgi:hypothetical protein